ncbi:ribosomal protein L7/L12 [Virgisporangium aurantiacum]|nr:ribosomal protein L7/L12 [Virgisporangium aurantiacum]
MWKVLLIVILVLVALVLLRSMFMRRGRGGELFVTEATGRPAIAPAGMKESIDSRELEFEVIRLLEQRKKILAIKLVRQHVRLGLKEAKDLVEEVERTGHLRLAHLPNAPFVAQEDVLDQARWLKREGKAIEAIKLIRQRTGLGLREAKDAYDRL